MSTHFTSPDPDRGRSTLRRAPTYTRYALVALLAACHAPRDTREVEPIPSTAEVPAGSATHPTTPAGTAPGFTWPIPAGWKNETIPFPLGFAPELAHRGVEELRFAPDFYTSGSSSYWSYDFVWWLEAQPRFDAPSISTDLTTYFRGLCRAVAQDKFALDLERIRVDLAWQPDAQGRVLTGTVATYDPFRTGEPVLLNVEARLHACPNRAHAGVVFLASPAALEAAIWTELRACAAAFRCD